MTFHTNNDAAYKSHWQISEVIFGIPFLIAIALQFLIPLSIPNGLLRSILISCGIAFIIIGIVFISLARQEFAKFSQPTDPDRPTTKVVTSGVFALSRNPMYFGAACFLVGVGLTTNWLWVLVLLLPSLVACHYVLIVPEEKYLVAKFGKEYSMYTSTVHRWIGHAQITHQNPKESK
jgi:protein-S-isoprenylcysteine O-methyltransferase Ste14